MPQKKYIVRLTRRRVQSSEVCRETDPEAQRQLARGSAEQQIPAFRRPMRTDRGVDRPGRSPTPSPAAPTRSRTSSPARCVLEGFERGAHGVSAERAWRRSSRYPKLLDGRTRQAQVLEACSLLYHGAAPGGLRELVVAPAGAPASWTVARSSTSIGPRQRKRRTLEKNGMTQRKAPRYWVIPPAARRVSSRTHMEQVLDVYVDQPY